MGLRMLNRALYLSSIMLLLCNSAIAQDGRFTFVPKGGTVPFQSTCFDDLATAKILTWKEFQDKEFQLKLDYELGLLSEQYQFKIREIGIKLEETEIRFQQTIKIKDKQIEDLQSIIKKDKKVNLPLAIGASILGGIAIGIGAAYAIDQALN